jgi:hypothetical protein
MDEQPPSNCAATGLPPRPSGTRILVAQDSAGITIMVPPRMGWFVLFNFIGSGVLFFIALLFFGWIAWNLFQAGCIPANTMEWLLLFLPAGMTFHGLFMLLSGVMSLNRRVYLSVQGDEFEVRWSNLAWEGRRHWPRSKIGRIYVDTQFRTAYLWIHVVGVDQLSFNNATLPEWEWVAALLRQALKQSETPPQASAAAGHSAVDEIIASPNQVRR